MRHHAMITGLLIIAVMVSSCGGAPAAAPTSAPKGSSPATTVAGQPQLSGAATGEEQAIEIGDNAFGLKATTVPVGATVIWTNVGRRPHTVTADNGAFASETLEPGATFRHTFTTPGSFRYYCRFHGGPEGAGMSAMVTVTGQAAAAGASASPTAAISPTTSPPAPTATATRAPTATAHPAARATGRLLWRDQTVNNDAALITLADLPAPAAGQVYAAWLTGADRQLFLGALGHDGRGAARLVFASSSEENLLSAYDRLLITSAAQAEAETAPSNVILAGALPERALGPIRQLLVEADATPRRAGYVLGLRREADEVLRHSQFLRDARAESNFPLVKQHAEHLVNIIDGAQGPNFGDLDGNGRVENPGDGFGLLRNGQQAGYITGMSDQARVAAAAPDATDEIKLHAEHVRITGDNTRVRLTDIRDRSLAILKATSLGETEEDVSRVLALAHQTIQGMDTNGDEQVAPIPGEGGTLTAYQHAQLMASIPLAREETTRPAASGTPTPPRATSGATPTGAQPVAPVAPTAALAGVMIGDGGFSPATLRVPVGTTVVWTHRGQAAHTVTADDGSFRSGTLRDGATFSHAFTTAGAFAYFCEFHGGPGGNGMSGVIIVGDN